MSHTDGEKELILGNKQLISLFFVVVALCGVFFAMGYMVRGNALKTKLPTGNEEETTSPASGIKRQQPEPPRETAETAPPETTPADTAPAPAADATPIETRPAQEGAGGGLPPSFTEPKPFQKTDTAQTAAPEAGATYVQVAALARADAESTVRTLREQHLPAGIAPSSKEGLYRVWVGPYHQTADVADAKARLKALGFSNTIVQKQ